MVLGYQIAYATGAGSKPSGRIGRPDLDLATRQPKDDRTSSCEYDMRCGADVGDSRRQQGLFTIWA